MAELKAKWSSNLTFVMATAGAAVGLGNIWRFPYIVGENGGGAFVLVYLSCVLLIGIPLMMSEFIIGRRGRHNPAGASRQVAVEAQRSRRWYFAGGLTIIAGFCMLSFYSVIAGWVIDYFFHSIIGTFDNVSIQVTNQNLSNLLSNPWRIIVSDSLIFITAGIIIGRGLKSGLEKTIHIMFPMLVILVLILLVYADHTGFFHQGVVFLFKPDLSELTPKSILLALGQAFFSLSIGTSINMMYGAYLPTNANIPRMAIIISLIDTAIALAAGLIIFPIVFANGLQPDSGPALIFKILPLAFSHMPYGSVFLALFFLMLEFAAFTSAIALLEPSVVWINETFNIPRGKATSIAVAALWIVSLGTVFSFNIAAHIKLFGMTFFQLIDHVTSNILLPLGGLFIAILTGWILPKATTISELSLSQTSLAYRYWRFMMRYFAPLAIIVILVSCL